MINIIHCRKVFLFPRANLPCVVLSFLQVAEATAVAVVALAGVTV